MIYCGHFGCLYGLRMGRLSAWKGHWFHVKPSLFVDFSVEQQTQCVLMTLFAFLPTALSPGSNGEFVFVFSIELKLGASYDKLEIADHIGSPPIPCLHRRLLGCRRVCSRKPGSFLQIPLTFLFHEGGSRCSSLNARWLYFWNLQFEGSPRFLI